MVSLEVSSLSLLFLLIHLHYFSVIASSPHSDSVKLCHPKDKSALLQFKKDFSFNSDASYGCDQNEYTDPKINSWNESSDCCKWDGVTCNSINGHVVGLDLSCSQLVGKIHSNSSLFSFEHLQRLNLAFNDFSDSQISYEFSRLQSLTHLNLSTTYFTGRIPSEISHLSKLVSLDLSNCDFLTIERQVLEKLVQNLTQLRELRLDWVDMPKVSPLSFANLPSSLSSLGLGYCGLHGELPTSIFNLPNLQYLMLANNFDLKVHFPEFNKNNSFRILDLSGVNFSGEIPPSIGNLTHLTFFNFSFTQYKGQIPSSFSYLHNLVYLDLAQSLENCIPDIFGNLTKLEYLNLFPSSNFKASKCPLPQSIFNLPRLFHLEFCRSNLVGSLPISTVGLSNLKFLDLSYNFINGTIPSWLFFLPSLEKMYLHYNQLTGEIVDFMKFNSLEVINLSNNLLQGSIPNSISSARNLSRLYLSSNNFSGLLDFNIFSELNLELLDFSNNTHLSFLNNKNFNNTHSGMTELFLSSCNLTEFPYFLTTLPGLVKLDLSNNNIRGKIPKWMMDQISSWVKLQIFDISSNLLHGPLPIPPSYVPSFSVSNNNFDGEIPLSICNTSILYLDLSNNSLSGTIPPCLGNFSTTLFMLDLQGNNFRGTIPDFLSTCNSLNYLNLNDNSLEGVIPRSLSRCQNLEVLDLGSNMMNDSFPHWLGTLPNLKVLVLRHNSFYGTIGNPRTNFSFNQLQVFDISHNNFTGQLPTKYFENLDAMMKTEGESSKPEYLSGNAPYNFSITVTYKGNERVMDRILSILAVIDFSSNGFSGDIPIGIRKLVGLKGLNLSHNHLTGHIPEWTENLINLEWLDLSSNKLTGEIPKKLTKLTSLGKLNLSYNQLVGAIPQGPQFNTFENDSYVGNLGLCGNPLPRKCEDDGENLPPESTDDGTTLFGFTWKIVSIGYGCGVIFGLCMGYLVFLIRKPKWIVTMVEGNQRRIVRRRKKTRRRVNRRN